MNTDPLRPVAFVQPDHLNVLAHSGRYLVRLEWWRGREGWSDVRGEALRLAIGAAMAQEKRDDRQRGV